MMRHTWLALIFVAILVPVAAYAGGKGGGGAPPPPPTTNVIGSLDSVTCSSDTAAGWAEDTDTLTSPVTVYFWIDSQPSSYTSTDGSVGLAIANEYRADLCTSGGKGGPSSCYFGFTFAIPSAYLDGQTHRLYAYGRDTSSSNGTALSGIPNTFKCYPPPSCSVTFDQNPINYGNSTIVHWTSQLATSMYINTIGYVTPNVSGSATVYGSGITQSSCAGAPGGTVQTFTSSGTFNVPAGVTSVDYLVVAGGGGGGQGSNSGRSRAAGGGGAGGFRTGSLSVVAGTPYTVTVGAGGAGSTNVGAPGASGGNSVFSSITSTGGGGGGSSTLEPGVSGGSGGGASASDTGGAGNTPSVSPSQGNNGGNAPGTGSTGESAGGGGAGAVGTNSSSGQGGAGGAGSASSITGSSVTYAGGGGGGVWTSGTSGPGGAGGGGAGGNSSGSAGGVGTVNTGGGGGGGGGSIGTGGAGGAGGSGVVIIKYTSSSDGSACTVPVDYSCTVQGTDTSRISAVALSVNAPSAPSVGINASSTSFPLGASTTVTATFAGNSLDPIVNDNIDSPAGTGLGATTPDATKVITFTPSSVGTFTLFARAITGFYNSWTSFASTTITVVDAPACSISFDQNPIPQGSSTNIHWSSSGADTFSINNIGSVTPNASGSALISPLQGTDYTGTATKLGSPFMCPASTGTPAGTLNVSCTPAYTCSDQQTILYTAADCATTQTACVAPTFCSAGSSTCLNPSPTFNQSGGLTGHLQVSPRILPAGTTTIITWNVGYVSSCSISSSVGSDSWSGASGSYTSSPITEQTIYTLACTGLDGSHVSENVIVNVLPKFQER